uniref:Uncharacterized protein n=1 Tax=Anguilla anguilla TaxID=7936 RepID=A0A0E9UX99_ANGAN
MAMHTENRGCLSTPGSLNSSLNTGDRGHIWQTESIPQHRHNSPRQTTSPALNIFGESCPACLRWQSKLLSRGSTLSP